MNHISGQNLPPNDYVAELTEITQILLQFQQTNGGKLAFVATTPFLCSSTANGIHECVADVADIARMRANTEQLRFRDHGSIQHHCDLILRCHC